MNKENQRFIAGLIIGSLITIIVAWFFWYISQPQPIEDLIEKGNRYFADGKYKKAIDCYDNAINIDPHNADVWRRKGIAYIELGAGTTDFKELIDNYLYRGTTTNHKNDESFRKALDCFCESLKFNHYDIKSWNYAGILCYYFGKVHFDGIKINDEHYVASGCFEEAINILPKIREHASGKGEHLELNYQEACAWYGIGKGWERDHLIENADEYFQKAREVCPWFFIE